MLEKITAPISRFVDGILSDGYDLEFETPRPAKSREPRDFVFCASRAGIETIERSYSRINRRLRPSVSRSPKLVRNIVINSN